MPRRGLSRSRRGFLSTVGRCSEAAILVRIVVESSCEGIVAVLGNVKVFNAETLGLKCSVRSSVISVFSSKDHLRVV